MPLRCGILAIMRVRASVLAAALLVPAVIIASPHERSVGPRSAEAAVSVVVSLAELVQTSTHVVVAKAAERQSLWEDTSSGRRIVTYTRLEVERTVIGDVGSGVWVRTLGGAVGSTGQWVSGEAVIAPESRSLLFLHKSGSTFSVAAMAQGHYPIVVTDGAIVRLSGSPDAGTLVMRRGPTIGAREVLVGATLDKALQIIGEARRAQKEQRK
jgi:hypothetical protein